MKKVIAMILTLAMLLSMIPAAAAAQTGMTRQEAETAVEELNARSDFYYELVDKYDTSDIEYRTEVRWWMAEGAHTDQTLEEEVQAMYDAGFRGVELCQLNVNGLNESEWGLGSDQWNHDFHVVLNKALDLGMSVGITSGTNWNTTNVPGLDPDSQAAMQCVIDSTENVTAGQTRSGALPLPGSIRSKANFIGAYAYPVTAVPIRSDSRYLQTTEMPSNPITYTIETDVILEQESTGFCFSATATDNFIMWQINNGDNVAGQIQCRPHVHKNGSWISSSNYDITGILGETTETLPGKLMHMKIEVLDGKTIKTYFNGSQTPAFTYTVPDAWGLCYLNKLGFRQDLDINSDTEELGRYDNIVVRDADGNVIYENTFDDPENPGFSGPGVKVVDGMLRVGLDQVEGANENILDADAVIDLTDKVVLNEDGRTGTLNWTAPAESNYIIFYLWSQGTAQRSMPAVQPSYCVNYFDKRGFEAWTKSFSETVLSDPALNEKIIKGDVQLFMDSLEFHWGSGFTFWAEEFAEEFQSRKGYDIRPYLILAKGLSGGPTVFGENAEFVRGTYELSDAVLGQKIRNDLHDVQTELYMENLLVPMEQWLNQYNIDLRAQISYGRTPEISEPSMAVDFPEAENLNQRNQVDIYRLWTGGAKLENKVLSSETGATFGMQYAYTHQQHLQEAYSLYAAGFSRINWHIWTSSWSPVSTGQSWPGFQSLSICNVLGLREPGYQNYYELNQHLGRVQQLLREGKARADVGMVYLKYNQEIPFSVSPASEDMFMQRHDYMLFPSTELQEHGYTYDYFSHEFLNAEDVYYDAEEGVLELAGYKALVLWQCWLALDGAQNILEMAKQGLKVVIVDGAAELSPYDEDEEALAEIMEQLKALPNVRVAASADDVLEALQALGVEPYAGFESNQLLTQVRETESGNRYLYVYNYCDSGLHDGDDEDHGRNATTEVAMDGTFLPYKIDAWSGEVTQLADYRWENGKTVFTVSLDYGDVALYAFEAVEKEQVHIVGVQNPTTAAVGRKIEAEDCTLIHALREDRPNIYTDAVASGGRGVDWISSQGDGMVLGVLEEPANQISVTYCTGETGTFGIYADGVWVADYAFTSNGSWNGKYQTKTFIIRPALEAGVELSVKRTGNAGCNIDCFYLSMNEELEQAQAMVEDGQTVLRTTKSGIYEVAFSDGTSRQLSAQVPASYPITDWTVKVEAWTPGEEIFREDTQNGVVNREHTFDTVKTDIDFALKQITTWDCIPEVGRNVSGRGYYDATFLWDGKADGAYLDFGTLINSMEVTINGVKTADVNMNRPVLDISDYLVEGENTIHLAYSSTLTNEMLTLGKIGTGCSMNNWGGYYIQYRSYGPAQAVIVPYMDLTAEPAVTEVSLSLVGDTETTAFDEAVSYTLSGANMVRLATMIVEIELDETYLTAPVATAAEGWCIVAQSVENGVLKVVTANLDGANGAGEILHLMARPNGTAGEVTVSVISAVLSAYEGLGETYVTARYEDAKVTTEIFASVYDVNRDGTVDLLDVTRAQRYYGTDNAICDVNADGTVNIDDLILILNNFTQQL